MIFKDRYSLETTTNSIINKNSYSDSDDEDDDDYTIQSWNASENGSDSNVKRHMSFLENDNINSLKPRTRSRHERQSISNIALTDVIDSSRSASLGNGLILSPHLPPTNSIMDPHGSCSLMNDQNLETLPSISLDSGEVNELNISHKRVAPYCFAFDIDGVILKGPSLIPEAKKAMTILNGNNKHNIIIPYIFVTNGGGTDEKLRAEKLTKMLECQVDEFQVIQGHTPMRSLTSKYENVLIVGGLGDDCRQIGLKYGFKNVFTIVDIIYWNPCVTPYYKLNEEETERALKDVDFSKIEIDAILVMADSRNWTVDQQIMLELLLSKKGVMGTHIDIKYDDNSEVIAKKLEETQPDLYFAHSDFVWATDYNLARYGMGALQVSLAALYKEHTNGLELPCKRFGKPQRTTFDFAAEFLEDWRKEVVKDVATSSKRRAQSISNAGFITKNTSISFTSRNGSFKAAKKNNSLMESSVTENNNADKILENDFYDENEPLSPTQKLSYMTSPLDDSDDESGDELTFDQKALSIPPPTTVYFVGDTPESDIRFANLHHESWFSILVETGVYQNGTKPKYEPKVIKKTVLDAVEWAIEREYEKEVQEWKNLSIDHL
ncbi:hypothetical protein QEN19_001976 [Hanseniaspora menglaensis]